MITRKFLLATFTIILTTLFSCSSLSGVKGEFSKPITGKALSVTVSLVSGGGIYPSPWLEITNPSSAKIPITPVKVKVIYKDGTETEKVYELKRKSLQEMEIKGGEILSGTLSVANPNQSEPAQPGAPASLSQGESITLMSTGSKSMPTKVQLSIGQEGSKELEVFSVTE